MASDVSPEILSAFLNSAWNSAKDGANSLRDQLLNEQSAGLELIKLGSIGSVGKNSTSQSYMGYGPGRITALQIVEAWSKLIEYYDGAKEIVLQGFTDAVITVPDDFDFDTSIYGLLTKAFQVGDSPRVPDIRLLRSPFNESEAA